MFITKTAINRPVTTLMISLGLIFLGIVSWRELPVQKLPDITFPSMYYVARTDEADLSPEKTNDDITRPFEKMVAVLPGLKETYSFTRSGEFWGYARFEQGTDMRFRVIELQDKVNKWTAGQSRRIYTLIVPHSTDEISGRLMELILSVPVGEEFRTASCGDLIRRKIRSIDGISQVEVAGEMLPNITLETHQDYLVAQGVDVRKMVDILNRLSQDKMWLGTLRDGRRLHDVQMVSRISTLEELMNTRIDDQGILPLEELVEPERKAEESKSIYRYNGKKAVRVSISKEKDRNTIQMARKVRKRIREIKEELPPGFDLTVVWDEAEILERLIRNVAKMAAIGAIMALFVLLFFVRSARIAMIVVTAIPASILITFNAMYAAGLSINILSLLGLAAGVGMLVDNSIVVVENVFRHFQRNKPPREAAWQGSREVSRAILVATATNLVVFVPLLFIDDIMIMVMKEMALSLVFPMIASLLIAVTLVPMLTSKVIEATSRRFPKKTGRARATSESLEKREVSRRRILSPDSLWVRFNPWQRPNRPPRNFIKEFVFYCAKGSLRHPIKLFSIIVFILGITLIAATIKIAFQPMMERYGQVEELTLYGKPPLGSDLEQTDRFFLEKERQVAELVEKSDVFDSFSSRFTKDGGEIEMKINKKYQKFMIWDFQYTYRELRSGDQNTGFRFWPFQQLSQASMTQQRFFRRGRSHMEGIIINGDNLDAMRYGAEKVKEFLQKQEVATEVEIETPLGEPEVHFYPDLELFQVMKADQESLRSFFRARGEGGIQTQLFLKEDDVERRITVKVISDDKEEEDERVRQTLSELKRTLVPLQGGGMVPLDHLGSFAVTYNLPYITKRNRQRELTVGFNLKPMYQRPNMAKAKEEKLKELQKDLGGIKIPPGTSAHLSGTLEEARTSRITWRKLIWLAILAVYLVMAFFFNSLISPLIILITLPLALIGGIWGLVFFRTSLDEIAMLGSIILAGIAVNNGILIVEYTRQMERLHGFRRPRAILSAVAYRLRPILMTSLTTILGLLPILFSEEAAKEARSLVSVIIGGMLASTFLSLVVVPTFYNVFSIGWEKLQALLHGRLRLFQKRFQIAVDMLPKPAPAASTGAGEIVFPLAYEEKAEKEKEPGHIVFTTTNNQQPTTNNQQSSHLRKKHLQDIPCFPVQKTSQRDPIACLSHRAQASQGCGGFETCQPGAGIRNVRAPGSQRRRENNPDEDSHGHGQTHVRRGGGFGLRSAFLQPGDQAADQLSPPKLRRLRIPDPGSIPEFLCAVLRYSRFCGKTEKDRGSYRTCGVAL
jgi:HAE1 family hydrophobic/amphiphilic exporter-1